MKIKHLLLLLLAATASQTFAQLDKSKPRVIRKSILLSPIDVSNIYTKDGIIGNNPATITVTATTKSIVDNAAGAPQTVKVLADTSITNAIEFAPNRAFNIDSQIGSFTIIKFWPLADATGKGFIKKMLATSPSGEKLNLTTYNNTIEVDELTAKQGSKSIDLTKSYYIVPTTTLLEKTAAFESKQHNVNIGLLVLPVKVRPWATEAGQFDFTAGLSMGATLCWTYHHNFASDISHNLLVYAGASTYTADESKIKETRDDYSITSFSPAIGYMFEKKRVQLSLLVGMDFPPGAVQKNWVYRNKPWIGIGVGIALFNVSNPDNTQAGTNK